MLLTPMVDTTGTDQNRKIMEIAEIYNRFKASTGVTTDSRKIQKGQMFIALKGENFDGNLYALQALEAGASCALVDASSEAAASGDERIIAVENTLTALWALARHHRSMTFVDGKPLTVIGLTGTNGKTTTKELIREVLSTKYRVTATQGNLNNNIGVPLTLLSINDETEIAVVEMGASHPGDIKELVAIALPNYGLITNVGKAHLLGFGSFDGVKATKGELYDYIQRTGDTAFVNVDNPHLVQMVSVHPDLHTIPYGLKAQGAKVLEASEEHPFLRIALPADLKGQPVQGSLLDAEPLHHASVEEGKAIVVETHLVGSYNADNVMAAIAVGQHFGISLARAVEAIAAYVPTNNRSQMTRTERNTLIVDAYNANPTSMEAAIDNFTAIKADTKMALLGDMLELGEESVAEHVKVVNKAVEAGLEEIALVGAEFGKAIQEIQGHDIGLSDEAPASVIIGGNMIWWFPDSEMLAEFLQEDAPENTTILVKGSRGIRMENVLSVL